MFGATARSNLNANLLRTGLRQAKKHGFASNFSGFVHLSCLWSQFSKDCTHILLGRCDDPTHTSRIGAFILCVKYISRPWNYLSRVLEWYICLEPVGRQQRKKGTQFKYKFHRMLFKLMYFHSDYINITPFAVLFGFKKEPHFLGVSPLQHLYL